MDGRQSRTAMQPLDTQRQRRLLRAPEVCERVGFTSTSTLYSAMERLGFPKPVKIGARSVAWIEEEVDAWVEARIAARDTCDSWQPLGEAAARSVEKWGHDDEHRRHRARHGERVSGMAGSSPPRTADCLRQG